MANNCPGGINEIIEEGINRENCSIENSELFAERIKILLNEKHDEEKIQNSIIRRFSKEIIINQYDKILSQILNDKNFINNTGLQYINVFVNIIDLFVDS